MRIGPDAQESSDGGDVGRADGTDVDNLGTYYSRQRPRTMVYVVLPPK